jgi:hypothetical protein
MFSMTFRRITIPCTLIHLRTSTLRMISALALNGTKRPGTRCRHPPIPRFAGQAARHPLFRPYHCSMSLHFRDHHNHMSPSLLCREKTEVSFSFIFLEDTITLLSLQLLVRILSFLVHFLLVYRLHIYGSRFSILYAYGGFGTCVRKGNKI